MQRTRTDLRSKGLGLLILCALAWAPANAADKHVHGHAALEVAVDGDRLLIVLVTPLDNLVGFEHAPRSDKQKDAVRRMAAQLKNPGQHFFPSADARCKPGPVTLASEVIDPWLLGSDVPETTASQAAAKATRGKREHAELEAEIVFRCEQPEKLSSLEVKLFDAFRGVKRIDVQVAGARKQAAARLTARSRRVSW